MKEKIYIIFKNNEEEYDDYSDWIEEIYKDKVKIRYIQILNRLDKPKTAKELAVELYELGFIPSTERNYTAPRLTELSRMGMVKVIDKKKCEYTGKTVAVYERTQKGFEAINMNHIPRI